MVARSGMFVAPLAGPPPVGMSPTDGRIAFSALIGTTAQLASGGAITQSASVMAITVAAAVWQLPDVSNAVGSSTFLSATDLFTPTPAAGPATGSRIDLICVKQNNVENSDADSRANVFLVAGTAGAPGVAPAVPAGAYLYATVNVPTSAANAAACTITVARPSTFAALPIKSSTLALLLTVTGSNWQQANVFADSYPFNNGLYVFSGGAWAPTSQAFNGVPAAPAVSTSAQTYSTLTIAVAGYYIITGIVKFDISTGAAVRLTTQLVQPAVAVRDTTVTGPNTTNYAGQAVVSWAGVMNPGTVVLTVATSAVGGTQNITAQSLTAILMGKVT